MQGDNCQPGPQQAVPGVPAGPEAWSKSGGRAWVRPRPTGDLYTEEQGFKKGLYLKAKQSNPQEIVNSTCFCSARHAWSRHSHRDTGTGCHSGWHGGVLVCGASSGLGSQRASRPQDPGAPKSHFLGPLLSGEYKG